MAGYSGTPLIKKIGIKDGDRVFLDQEPPGFRKVISDLPSDCSVLTKARTDVNVAIVFTTSAAELRRRFRPAARAIVQSGMLWVAWPKKSSGVATDLTESIVREIGLSEGLVDTKVCAIDETWSGLRFVMRLKDRK